MFTRREIQELGPTVREEALAELGAEARYLEERLGTEITTAVERGASRYQNAGRLVGTLLAAGALVAIPELRERFVEPACMGDVGAAMMSGLILYAGRLAGKTVGVLCNTVSMNGAPRYVREYYATQRAIQAFDNVPR